MKLRYYQEAAVNAVFEYFYNNDGNPLIVLPTAAGKSLVQADIAKRLTTEFSGQRILFCTHQQTLIQQNYDEMMQYLDNPDMGIYSAGLKRRDCFNQIIHCGIQSVYKKAMYLGSFALMVVDECHLIPHDGEGMYRKFIDDMLKINPYMKIIGLTATPYRLKGGILTDGDNKIFTDICYEVSVAELIAQGFLCKLVSKNSRTRADLSDVHIRGGEFVADELAAACDKQELISKTVKEIINTTENRKRCMVFTVGIEHCEHVKEEFIKCGFTANSVHSKNTADHNAQVINDFKDGKLKFLINVDILTTGFNVKSVDCIAMLRPTKSPGLYYQIVGRGLRIHPDKQDCLILDFAGNILRHGPIDKIEIKKNVLSGKKELVAAPMKECPKCGNLLFLSQMECAECGYIIESTPKHDYFASSLSPISEYKEPEWKDVSWITYKKHTKAGKSSLKVTYNQDFLNSWSEYICIEHGGFAATAAKRWLKERTSGIINTVDDALELSENFNKPTQILIDNNNKYPRIIGYRYEEVKECQKKSKEWIRR